MSNKKQVRFDTKPTIINDTETSNDFKKNLEDENANATEKLTSAQNSVDGMWDKLVTYYLSRIKGLVDWRPYWKTRRRKRCRKYKSVTTLGNSSNEQEVISQITEQAMKNCVNCPNQHDLSDIGTFMAAGYKEGKERAARIVIRSLKYGVLTGILEKDGSTYRIRPKFFGAVVKKKKKIGHTPKDNYGMFSNSKRKRRKHKDNCCYCDTKNSRKKTVTPPFSYTSQSDSNKSIYKVYEPRAQRKRPRKVIKKPVVPKPNRKRRGRSQTKSPTPTRSRSKSLTKYKPRRLRSYKTSLTRRPGSILSSISSKTSICTLCRFKRKRSGFSQGFSNTSRTVKKNNFRRKIIKPN